MPLPLPIPVPVGPGQQQGYVTVVVNGGNAFPNITNSFTIAYRPGLTAGSALAQAGAVAYSPAGQIVSVGGIPIGGNIRYQLRVNGRTIPPSLLGAPIQPSDTVSIELFVGVG